MPHDKQPDLVLLDCRRRAKVLAQTYPQILDRCRLVALSLEAAGALEDLDRPFVAAWDYLESQEYLSVIEEADALLASWTEPFSSLCVYKGADIPAWHVEIVRFVFRDGVYLATALPRLFADLSAESVAIPGLITRPAMYYLESDAAAALGAYVALHCGLKADILPPEEAWPGAEMHLPGADPGRVDRALRAIEERRGHRQVIVINGHGLKGLVFLARSLHQAGYLAVVLALGNLPQAEREALTELATIIDVGLPYDTPIPDRYRRHFDAARHAFMARQENYDGVRGELFGNPLLSYQFEYYFRAFWPAAAWLLDGMEEVLARLSPDCLITSDLLDPEVRLCLHAAHRLSIPTIVGLHAGWPRPDCSAPADSIMLLSGETHRAYVAARWPGRLRVVGPLAAPVQCAFNTQEGARARLNIPPNRRILLVMSGHVSVTAFPHCSPHEHIATLATLLRFPDDLDQWIHIVIKKKPLIDESWIYDRALTMIHDNDHVTLVEDIPLDILVELCDVAVMVSATTTSFLDPILRGKPLLWIQTTPMHEINLLPLPRLGVEKIESDDQIWPTLTRLFRDPAYREEVVARQRAFWRKDMPTDGIARGIVEVVHEVTNRKPSGRAAIL